ncbi:MAG: hypothetical protein PHU25_05670 [Deltaproteobacteria bacterium]|nr:hypothetical protein [Deltaproteobacteria bacterium]
MDKNQSMSLKSADKERAEGKTRLQRALQGVTAPVVITVAAVLGLVGVGATARKDAEGTMVVPQGYDLISGDNGVEVYQNRNTDIIELLAQGRLPASPQAVMAGLIDYEHQVGVIARVSESRILERGPDSMTVYQRLNLPIVSDRDYVLRVVWRVKGDKTWIRYHAVGGQGPAPVDGVVRVTHHQGGWDLTAVDGGRATLAVFHDSIDMGGLLPKALARAGAGREVPSLYRDVCRLLQVGKITGVASCP